LEALRNNPQFQQLRTLVQSNPQLLEPIIQNIAQGNPQFAALINQNPEGFFQLLAEGAGGGEGGILPAGAIQVTPEEAEAIGRVISPFSHFKVRDWVANGCVVGSIGVSSKYGCYSIHCMRQK
jgi:UV excision repair protein RAD23